MHIRFTIRDLLLLIFAVAIALTTFQMFWEKSPTNSFSPLSDNYRFVFAVYLAVLVLASAGTRLAARPVRRFSIGYSVFGWTYLICALHAGFEPLNDFEQRWGFARSSLMGICFGLLVGFVACFAGQLAIPSEGPKTQ
jgi:hypothetical protein